MKLILIFLISLLYSLPAFAGEMTYEIKKGDELMLISKKIYGTYHQWQKIVKANPSIHPNFLQIGHKIIIPDVTVSNVAKNETIQPEIDEFTEESVLSLLDLKRKPANESFIENVKKFFKKEPVENDHPVEGFDLENKAPEKNEELTVGHDANFIPGHFDTFVATSFPKRRSIK